MVNNWVSFHHDRDHRCVVNTHLMRIGIFISDPTAQSGSPVFDDECFGEFLALSVTETALGFTSGDQERPVAGQSHLEPLANVVLDGRTRTPSAATFFHSDSLNKIDCFCFKSR